MALQQLDPGMVERLIKVAKDVTATMILFGLAGVLSYQLFWEIRPIVPKVEAGVKQLAEHTVESRAFYIEHLKTMQEVTRLQRIQCRAYLESLRKDSTPCGSFP